ncbi:MULTISPECIES: hypothetical protein [unclassified Kitasatospora]|uniref:hypothetical protein n=1 Tax=unclassified Kitasatospora TaxID=2633591 RepID=UPI0012FC4207
MRDYPTMGIPHYLIVDPRTGTGLVLSAPHPTPEGPRYSTRREFHFGETVQLSTYDIETAEFPTY